MAEVLDYAREVVPYLCDLSVELDVGDRFAQAWAILQEERETVSLEVFHRGRIGLIKDQAVGR